MRYKQLSNTQCTTTHALGKYHSLSYSFLHRPYIPKLCLTHQHCRFRNFNVIIAMHSDPWVAEYNVSYQTNRWEKRQYLHHFFNCALWSYEPLTNFNNQCNPMLLFLHFPHRCRHPLRTSGMSLADTREALFAHNRNIARVFFFATRSNENRTQKFPFTALYCRNSVSVKLYASKKFTHVREVKAP